jgi:hypothetical protein
VGIPEVLALRLLVLLVVACSLLLAGWTMRRSLPDLTAGRSLTLFVALFVLLPMSGYDFGQREHLMFALVLPYLLMAAGRAVGVPMGGAIPWIAGTMAGFGVALKPHFVLLWAAVEGYLARVGRGRRTWLRPEALSVAAMGLAYAIAVVTISPEYLRLVGWARSIYVACNPASFWSLLSHPAIFVSLIAWTGFSLVRPGGHYRECCRLLLIANVSFVIIALVQWKGYPYHYYPTFASAVLLLGLLFAESRGLSSGRSRIAGLLSVVVAAAVMVQASADRVVESVQWRGNPARSDTPFGAMVRLARDHARGGSIFTFSAAVADSFPLVTYSGVGWASRHPCLWFLPGLYSGYDGSTDTFPYRPLEGMGEAERYLFDGVVDDLVRDRPTLLLVDETERKGAFGAQRFDYLQYFGRDPRLAAFLREYEPLTKVGAFRVYRRRVEGPFYRQESSSSTDVNGPDPFGREDRRPIPVQVSGPVCASIRPNSAAAIGRLKLDRRPRTRAAIAINAVANSTIDEGSGTADSAARLPMNWSA